MRSSLRLSEADEFFNHQVAMPHQVVASSDPNWRERIWVSVHDVVAKDYVLSFGFGKYPNRDVMEGFAIFGRGAAQRNVRMSRQLSPHHGAISVGPMRAEVLEPLRKLRFVLDENESGLAFDLEWSGAVAPALEGRHFEVSRARVSHDLVRYVQTGRLTGRIFANGESFEARPDRCWGVRDHSWGVRPMRAVEGDPPLQSPAWKFLLFCPLQFEGFSLHFYLFESAPGRPTHLSASIMRADPDDDRDEDIKSVRHDFVWDESAPALTLKEGRVVLEFYARPPMEIEIKACPGRAYLLGGGYGLSHGLWRGESHIEHDVYDLTDTDKQRAYSASSSDHMVEARCEGQIGFGVVEYLMRRGYPGRPR